MKRNSQMPAVAGRIGPRSGPVLRICPSDADPCIVFVNKLMADPEVGVLIARSITRIYAPACRTGLFAEWVPEEFREQPGASGRGGPDGGAA